MSRLTSVATVGPDRPPARRGPTTQHVWMTLLVFGFTALLIVLGQEPAPALGLALAGLAGVLLLTSAGPALNALRRATVHALSNDAGDTGTGQPGSAS
ncbi:hypothetical protein [Saccharothrix variisporea]|uniref:Uncharacterized protein n=1 Tax=Saccharothrix variisporea TaxID=543527 RepID=A0A495XFT2_9PSEU|nr:hypothetical protein [Saccharothrix variisporea]RKT71483.1 hypothetical protein DFJ66_4773 [Saccharothrix variisporea]